MTSRRRRVVVVDDNTLTMPGFVLALEQATDFEVAGALDHDQALAWDAEWRGIDAVILDAAEENRPGDQFPGVAVVRAIRRVTADLPVAPLVVVVTGHYLHDGLRHRMAVAGADFFFLRSELRRAGDLVDIVLHPERYRRGVPGVADGERRAALGIRPATDVEAIVDYIEAESLETAFDPEQPERDNVRSRAWRRHRGAMGSAGRLDAVNLTTGQPPANQDAPSIRQLRQVWAWAARVRRVER